MGGCSPPSTHPTHLCTWTPTHTLAGCIHWGWCKGVGAGRGAGMKLSVKAMEQAMGGVCVRVCPMPFSVHPTRKLPRPVWQLWSPKWQVHAACPRGKGVGCRCKSGGWQDCPCSCMSNKVAVVLWNSGLVCSPCQHRKFKQCTSMRKHCSLMLIDDGHHVLSLIVLLFVCDEQVQARTTRACRHPTSKPSGAGRQQQASCARGYQFTARYESRCNACCNHAASWKLLTQLSSKDHVKLHSLTGLCLVALPAHASERNQLCARNCGLGRSLP